MKLPSNCHIFLALSLFCIGFPSSSFSEAARICEAPIMADITVHTFVRLTKSSCSSSGPKCEVKAPFTNCCNIGFEKKDWWGHGGLRDDSGDSCNDWTDGYIGKVAAAASASQERQALSDLSNNGWINAGYGILAGGGGERFNAFCNPKTKSYNPRPGPTNVCWTFTCAYVSYLYQKFKVQPPAIASEFSIRSSLDVPSTWTCKPEQYGSGDGCQCTCGAFDPDCDPKAAVALDCPNPDDICTPGPDDDPICSLRQTVLSDRKTLAIMKGEPVHDPTYHFSNDTDAASGGPWGNYSSAFTRSDVPSTWTCNPLFYGSKDGCDCHCGAWDPDCDATTGSTQRVFNCQVFDQAQCAMSKTTPSNPVCLFDQLAETADVAAGFPSPSSSQARISTPVIIGASIGSTLGVVALLAAVTYFIRKRAQRRDGAGEHMKPLL